MKKTRTRTNDNSISDQMRSANKCSRRPRSAARYVVWTARRHSTDRSITKNYRKIIVTAKSTSQPSPLDRWFAHHLMTICVVHLCRMIQNNRVRKKIGVRDKLYDTMAFTFSEDSRISHGIRTGHLPKTRCDPKVLRRVVLTLKSPN